MVLYFHPHGTEIVTVNGNVIYRCLASRTDILSDRKLFHLNAVYEPSPPAGTINMDSAQNLVVNSTPVQFIIDIYDKNETPELLQTKWTLGGCLIRRYTIGYEKWPGESFALYYSAIVEVTGTINKVDY